MHRLLEWRTCVEHSRETHKRKCAHVEETQLSDQLNIPRASSQLFFSSLLHHLSSELYQIQSMRVCVQVWFWSRLLIRPDKKIATFTWRQLHLQQHRVIVTVSVNGFPDDELFDAPHGKFIPTEGGLPVSYPNAWLRNNLSRLPDSSSPYPVRAKSLLKPGINRSSLYVSSNRFT